MEERKKVVIDAGHGGSDLGAVYYGRREKDDVLNLALAVGNALSDYGIDVVYTRVNDTNDTPFDRATMANEAGAHYFVSLHRNAMPTPNTASGVESLVFKNDGVRGNLANHINEALEQVGFRNLGILERPSLVLLRQTQMPAVMVEVGFIDSEVDNRFFDSNFAAIALAIAKGILAAIQQETKQEQEYYQVQVGAYRSQMLAEQLSTQLLSQGFPAFIVYEGNLYKVRVGAYQNLDHAIEMEKQLRQYGYNTFIVKAREVT